MKNQPEVAARGYWHALKSQPGKFAGGFASSLAMVAICTDGLTSRFLLVNYANSETGTPRLVNAYKVFVCLTILCGLTSLAALVIKRRCTRWVAGAALGLGATFLRLSGATLAALCVAVGTHIGWSLQGALADELNAAGYFGFAGFFAAFFICAAAVVDCWRADFQAPTFLLRNGVQNPRSISHFSTSSVGTSSRKREGRWNMSP